MTAGQIRDAEGAHLTAADRRNLRGLLAHDAFTFGEWFAVNGRKGYRVDEDGPDRYRVTIRETYRHPFTGELVPRYYRGTFTTAGAIR